MYEIAREGISGRVLGVKKNGIEHVTKAGIGWQEFLDWNAKQPNSLDLNDKEPEPPPRDTELEALTR